MKRHNKIAMIGALGLALASGAAWAQTAPDGQVRGPGPGGRKMGPPPPEIMEKYDANKDGQLDETERAALKQDIADGKIQPPQRGPGGPGGPRPPMGPPPKEILEKYDVNKDGKLDDTEHAAIRKDIEAGKLQPPGRRGGPPPEILKQYDTDQDGKLSETERAALEKDVADGKLPPPPRGHRPPPDEPAPDAVPQQ